MKYIYIYIITTRNFYFEKVMLWLSIFNEIHEKNYTLMLITFVNKLDP
jgi:hypothetical protein